MQKIAKIGVFELFVQKSGKKFWLKIMPLPGKFPGDAHVPYFSQIYPTFATFPFFSQPISTSHSPYHIFTTFPRSVENFED